MSWDTDTVRYSNLWSKGEYYGWFDESRAQAGAVERHRTLFTCMLKSDLYNEESIVLREDKQRKPVSDPQAS